MSFEDFFGHAFVDLIHAPSEVSADQARNLILDAERAERDGVSSRVAVGCTNRP